MSGVVALQHLTVLYDADSALCRSFGAWLARQPMIVPIDLVAAGSAEARRRMPSLDHDRTLEEITVVGDDGRVWTHEHAWVMCLWVTRNHRPLAERLARPGWLPLARAAACTSAGIRTLTRTSFGGNYIDDGVAPPLDVLGQSDGFHPALGQG